MAGEQRVVLREAGLGAERLLEDRAVEALGERDQRRPALVAVRAGAGDRARGSSRASRTPASASTAAGSAACERSSSAGPSVSCGSGRGRRPVVHRDDHDRGSAGGDGLVVGADDRAGHVLGAGGLVAPDRVLAREAVQLAGQERVEREVAAVLLADDDHQRRAVGARGGDRGDGVAEAGRAVQQRERGRAAAERVAGGHRHDGALVQREHERQVLGQAGEQRDLGRAGVGEDRRQPQAPEHVERGVADGRGGRGLVQVTARSFDTLTW